MHPISSLWYSLFVWVINRRCAMVSLAVSHLCFFFMDYKIIIYYIHIQTMINIFYKNNLDIENEGFSKTSYGKFTAKAPTRSVSFWHQTYATWGRSQIQGIHIFKAHHGFLRFHEHVIFISFYIIWNHTMFAIVEVFDFYRNLVCSNVVFWCILMDDRKCVAAQPPQEWMGK